MLSTTIPCRGGGGPFLMILSPKPLNPRALLCDLGVLGYRVAGFRVSRLRGGLRSFWFRVSGLGGLRGGRVESNLGVGVDGKIV